MKCEACGEEFPAEDLTEHEGMQLCEDCCMDAFDSARPKDCMHGARKANAKIRMKQDDQQASPDQ